MSVWIVSSCLLNLMLLFNFLQVVKTLDDRDLVMTCLPGEVIKHGDVKCVLNEGMPQYKNPFEKG